MTQPPEEWNQPSQHPPAPGYQPYPPQQGPYGAPPPGYGPQAQYSSPPNHSNGQGIAGFVLGLLGVVLFWVPGLGLVLGVLGIVFGGTGMNNGRRTGASNGLAIAGLVLGIIAVVVGILYLIGLATD